MSDMINLKMPPKPPADAAQQDSTNDDVNAGAGNPDDEAQNEAQEIMEGIKDQPEVCHALYAMLQEKYEPQQEQEGEGQPQDDYTMSEEGKPAY